MPTEITPKPEIINQEGAGKLKPMVQPETPVAGAKPQTPEQIQEQSTPTEVSHTTIAPTPTEEIKPVIPEVKQKIPLAQPETAKPKEQPVSQAKEEEPDKNKNPWWKFWGTNKETPSEKIVKTGDAPKIEEIAAKGAPNTGTTPDTETPEQKM